MSGETIEVLFFLVLLCYTVQYCTVFYCTIGLLYFTVLYCNVLCSTVLYLVVLYCNVLYFVLLYCTLLCTNVLYFVVLQYTVLCCTAMYVIVGYRTVLEHPDPQECAQEAGLVLASHPTSPRQKRLRNDRVTMWGSVCVSHPKSLYIQTWWGKPITLFLCSDTRTQYIL